MKKRFLLSFLIAFIIFGAGYFWLFNKIEGGMSRAEKIERESGIGEIKEAESNPISDDLNEVFFLLVGVDTDSVDRKKSHEKKDIGIRSDTMMLVRVNFDDGSVRIMSLPRDSRVPVNGSLDKLNHAHSYGGMPLLMETVRDFTDLDVRNYVRVDFDAVEKIVDAIGGVEVDIPEKMYKEGSDPGREFVIDFEPGRQRLNGKQAVLFLRYREYEDGDLGRVRNQQYFMKEMIKQALAPKNIFKIPELLDIYSNYVDTNLGTNMVYAGARMATRLDLDNIETTTYPGEEKRLELSYYILDKEEGPKLIKEYFGDYLLDK